MQQVFFLQAIKVDDTTIKSNGNDNFMIDSCILLTFVSFARCHIITAAGIRPNKMYSRSRDSCICEWKNNLKTEKKKSLQKKKNTKNENEKRRRRQRRQRRKTKLNVNKHSDAPTVDECVGRQTAAVVVERSCL